MFINKLKQAKKKRSLQHFAEAEPTNLIAMLTTEMQLGTNNESENATLDSKNCFKEIIDQKHCRRFFN